MRLLAASLALLPFLLAPALPRPATAACDTSGLPDGTEIAELTLTNGTLCLELLKDDAPNHVENFLWYLNRGDYDGSLFHRYVSDFVLQGGNKRRAAGGGYEFVPTRPNHTVVNEPCTLDTPAGIPEQPSLEICSERGNERGTIALAKLGPESPGGGPDSGTTNWYINLDDNRPNLDNQNGGFTVFARVLGSGMDYVDTLLPTDYLSNWLTGSLASDNSALMALPSYGGYDGCFDPLGRFSVVVDPNNPSQGKPDPRNSAGFSFFFLSSECGGTLVPDPNSFVPNPCTGNWTTEDELAVGIDPPSLAFVPFPPEYRRFNCAEVDASTGAEASFEASIAGMTDPTFQEAYEQQVVFIESTRHIVVPEPSATALGAAALATLVVWRGRRSRH